MSPIFDVADLERRLIAAQYLQQHVTDETIDQHLAWAAARSVGRHFEHLLWLYEQSFYVVLVMYLMAFDVAIGLLYGEFILDAALYGRKTRCRFYEVRTYCGRL